MEMQNARQLAITQQQAWDMLNDTAVLQTCIPGCESIKAAGDNTYALVNAVKIGPMAVRFKGVITLSDMQVPSAYTLNFEGNGGVSGFGKGSARITLKPQSVGCEMSYTVRATASGKIAQIGQRLIDSAVKSMTERFFKRFDKEIKRRYPPPGNEDAANEQEPGKFKQIWPRLTGGGQPPQPPAQG